MSVGIKTNELLGDIYPTQVVLVVMSLRYATLAPLSCFVLGGNQFSVVGKCKN